MSTPINKEHDVEYWRRKYEKMREGLHKILKLTQDEEATYDDIVNDAEVTAYRHLYEEE
jgi:hypothetical protein